LIRMSRRSKASLILRAFPFFVSCTSAHAPCCPKRRTIRCSIGQGTLQGEKSTASHSKRLRIEEVRKSTSQMRPTLRSTQSTNRRRAENCLEAPGRDLAGTRGCRPRIPSPSPVDRPTRLERIPARWTLRFLRLRRNCRQEDFPPDTPTFTWGMYTSTIYTPIQ